MTCLLGRSGPPEFRVITLRHGPLLEVCRSWWKHAEDVEASRWKPVEAVGKRWKTCGRQGRGWKGCGRSGRGLEGGGKVQKRWEGTGSNGTLQGGIIYFSLLRISSGDLLLYMHWSDSFWPVLIGFTWYRSESIGLRIQLEKLEKFPTVWPILWSKISDQNPTSYNWFRLEPVGHSKDLAFIQESICSIASALNIIFETNDNLPIAELTSKAYSLFGEDGGIRLAMDIHAQSALKNTKPLQIMVPRTMILLLYWVLMITGLCQL